MNTCVSLMQHASVLLLCPAQKKPFPTCQERALSAMQESVAGEVHL